MFNLFKLMLRGGPKELGHFEQITCGKGSIKPDGEISLKFTNMEGERHEVNISPFRASLLIVLLAEKIGWCNELFGMIGIPTREQRKAATVRVLENILNDLKKNA